MTSKSHAEDTGAIGVYFIDLFCPFFPGCSAAPGWGRLFGSYCPSYCNATGHLIEAQDCGMMGWCCGTNKVPTCCTDYFEHLLDFPANATEENCTAIRDELFEDGPLGGADTVLGYHR